MARQFRSEELTPAGAGHPQPMGDFPHAAGKSATRLVLVVDDEPLIRWSLSETLSDWGYDVLEAGDAQTALRTAAGATRPIDVVLLDFRLPDSNDLSLLARLKALIPKSRIIMMTAFGTPEMAQAAREMGAVEVVNKPFEVADLALLVQTASPARC